MTKTKKTLSLRTETIRQLDDNSLGQAVGGSYYSYYVTGGGGSGTSLSLGGVGPRPPGPGPSGTAITH